MLRLSAMTRTGDGESPGGVSTVLEGTGAEQRERLHGLERRAGQDRAGTVAARPEDTTPIVDRDDIDLVTALDFASTENLDDQRRCHVAEATAQIASARRSAVSASQPVDRAMTRPPLPGKPGIRDGADGYRRCVADLERDTSVVCVHSGDGRSDHTAVLSEEWAIRGPMGGYIASIALRAAGHHCGRDQPASINASFLSEARFAPVTIVAETLRTTRVTSCVRVLVAQNERAVLEATVWGTDTAEGLGPRRPPRPDRRRIRDVDRRRAPPRGRRQHAPVPSRLPTPRPVAAGSQSKTRTPRMFLSSRMSW
jgi:hypothetical protein